MAANGDTAPEHHTESGGRVKSIVFGGLDGILTSFAIVAGAVGAHLSPVTTHHYVPLRSKRKKRAAPTQCPNPVPRPGALGRQTSAELVHVAMIPPSE